MNRKVRITMATLMAISVAATMLGVASKAEAGSQTSTLAVAAQVTANCTISTSALAFGSYDPVVTNATTALNGTGTVTVTCTSGASTNVLLGQGSNASVGSTDAVPIRRMTDGATHYLSYAIFQDTGRSTTWGNTNATSEAYTGTGSSSALTVYGKVDAGQNVPAGSYTDSVLATISF